MKIIISPAKKMKVDTDTFGVKRLPIFLEDSKILCEGIKKMSYEEVKALWKCNDKLAKLNVKRFADMDLERNLTPALLAYEGLQYQHMSPIVLSHKALDYMDSHLRILSGFYGILSPFDGVVPYRLEMQAKYAISGKKDLYEFWSERIYRKLTAKDHTIVNLASKEYSRVVEQYLSPEDTFLTCVFGELDNGKIKQKGTFAKMARGEMVSYMAENQVSDVDSLKQFDRLGYQYIEAYSSKNQLSFVRKAT